MGTLYAIAYVICVGRTGRERGTRGRAERQISASAPYANSPQKERPQSRGPATRAAE